MIDTTFLILKFFIVEVKLVKKRFNFLINFVKEISIIKFIFYYFFNKSILPFRDINLNNYLKCNYLIWKKSKKKKNKKILVDLTLSSHPLYAMAQCIVACNLRYITGYDCKAIVNKYDFLTNQIAKSFLIDDFFFIQNSIFFKRFYYYLKSILILDQKNILKNLLKLQKDKIEIGKSAYEFLIRNYVKNFPSKKDNYLLYIALSKSLESYDFSKIIFSDKNIKYFIISELQFIPYRIFFQNSLLKKIKVFSPFVFSNSNKVSISAFDKFSHKNSHRMKFSKKLLNLISKNYKNQIQNKIEKFIKKENKEYQLGFGEKHLKDMMKKKTVSFKSKVDFCNKLKIDKNKKNILILPNVFVDNLLTHDWGIYDTPIDWFQSTLQHIKNIDKVNWIIKPHPSEKVYNTNITTKKIFNNIISNSKNIKLLDENKNIKNLKNYISAVISFGGSAGYEYTKYGIPVVTVADSRYSNFNLTETPKNEKQYLKLLSNIHKLKKISEDKKFRASFYWYLIKELSKVELENLPIFDSKRHTSEKKKFWKIAFNKNKRFKKYSSNSVFTKNFYFQYKNKNRHLINSQLLSNSKKSLDLKINDL